MVPDDFPAGGYVLDYVLHLIGLAAVIAVTVVFFRARRGRSGLARLILGNILVLASLLATVIVVGETYLRYVYDATDQWGVTLTTISWGKRHFRGNQQGFRDREFTSKRREGVVRVACVGDSFTMGWGVDDAKDAWPQRLAGLLDERARGRFETLNLGKAGSGTGDEAALLDQMAPRGVFERVVLGYCLNDADDLLPRDRQFHAATLPRPTWIEPHSFVVDFLWFRVRLRDDPRVSEADARQREAYEDPAVWARQRARIAHISETCRAAGVPLDVVVFPFFSSWGDDYKFGACHDQVVRAWSDVGVRAFDLRETYRGISRSQLAVNRFDGHPNARAHELAARAVAEEVLGVR